MGTEGARVLLADLDEAAIVRVAEALRPRGFDVVCATTVTSACDAAREGIDAVVATRRMIEDESSGLGLVDAMALETTSNPPFVIWGDEWSEDAPGELEAKLRALLPHVTRSGVAARRVALGAAFVDLLRELSDDRATGTVSVHGGRASGEVRIASGRIVDAVHGRVDGDKALARLLGEREGSAVFVPGSLDVLPRMDRTAADALEAVERSRDRAATLRDELGLEAPDVLLMAPAGIDLESEASRAIVPRLRVPITLDDLLDLVPQPDEIVLEVVAGLARGGHLKRLGRASLRAQVADVDSLAVLKGLAARLRAPGFDGAARVVLAAMHSRVGVLAQAATSLADAVASPAAPSLPIPHPIATVRFGDGVDLEVVALPLVPAYAPTWAAALAGAALVVQIDEAATANLADICQGLEVALVPAREIAPDLGEDIAPEQLAALLRAALEAGAGA